MKAHLNKTSIFCLDFNDFMKHWGVIRITWGHFGVTLGSFFGHQGDFGALCEPFRRRKALDGKCDGYMWGLGGAEKRKCGCFLSAVLKGQEGHEEFKKTNDPVSRTVWEGEGRG